MLTNNGIELLDLHFFWHGLFVLAGRVVVTGSCRGNQFYFVSHLFASLDLLTFGSQSRDDLIDALLINDSHALG